MKMIINCIKWAEKKSCHGWVGRWMDGLMEVKAGLGIAYSNKNKQKVSYSKIH